MARLLYALSGYGRGHHSRALAVAGALRARGHEVLFCCGGDAARALGGAGEAVVPVPAPAQHLRRNRVLLARSAWANAPLAVRTPALVADLAERLRPLALDLVVADFEPFAARAAERLGVPVVALDHQQILTEAACRLPLRFAAAAAVTRLGIRLIAPADPVHRLIPSFFFPELRDPRRATLLPPILRPDAEAARPARGEHVLVYYNFSAGATADLRAVAAAGRPVLAYNFSGSPPIPGVTYRAPSRAGFLEDLRRCRAVVCTAGFTLLSEALHLGKPVLAVPNRGFAEQAVNALYLRRGGHGEAVFGRLRAADVTAFLAAHRPRPVGGKKKSGGSVTGAELAAAALERVLRRRPTGLAVGG